jgi:hypothetical protein
VPWQVWTTTISTTMTTTRTRTPIRERRPGQVQEQAQARGIGQLRDGFEVVHERAGEKEASESSFSELEDGS